MDQTVFRLSRIPAVFDKSGVEKLLRRELALKSDVKVFSLAQSVGPFFQTKTATLMFKEGSDIREALYGGKIPHVSKFGDHKWTIDVVDLHSPIILDTHFRGLTPLDDPGVHTLDCIAISGLSSHPFGSWQPRGQEKKFMWIRDSLKKEVLGLRPILYGYDSALLNSDSFQSIPDLAKDLLAQLEMGHLTHSSSKPLIFLAHSLGGLILKQAMVSDNSLCVNTRGAIFFGVPNLGMDQSSLLTMVEGQANESLVRDLADESAYLLELNRLFLGYLSWRKC